jgi:hypothetical protein
MGGVYSQLAGMIEMTHVVLRLLATLTKEEGALRVSLFSLLSTCSIIYFSIMF